MQSSNFQEVQSIEEINHLYKIAERVIVRSSITITALTKKEGWIPICIHEDLLNMYQIASILKKHNYEMIIGLAWSRDDDEHLATIFDSTDDSVGQFISRQWSSAYLLFSGDPDWIILAEKILGFCFVYGEKKFLEDLIGISQDEAFVSIEEVIAESRFITDIGREHFKNLLHQLRDVYPNLLPGDTFTFEFT